MACATCGMTTKNVAEFHPHAFCVWFKAGLDPWETLHWVNERLGVDMSRFDERQPPLVRDLRDLVAP